jgi:putative membrane protein
MSLAQTVPLADTWMHGGWGWGWMSVMMVMMVLFWGAVVFGAVWLIRGAAWDRSVSERRVGSESPTEILDRRFAEGEIEEEDYRARREVLADRGHPTGRT